MADRTGIEWTDATWNPITGCTKVSPGCDHCYAENIAHRFAGTKAYPQGFEVTLRPERMDQPLRWRRPRRVFVNSMSDLFHQDVPDEYIARVWAVMALASAHTFQVLTKRHARMRSLLTSESFKDTVLIDMTQIAAERGHTWPPTHGHVWPRPNVWVGVSTEDQQWADIRIPALLDTPAAVRFISAEPLLGPINLRQSLAKYSPGDEHPWNGDQLRARELLHWVIAGGESGPGARPMHPDWVESLRDQCVRADVPFLFKQWGEWTPLAPIDEKGRFDFRGAHSLANDGTLYEPGALAYPDGPRWGEAIRADHGRAHLTSMYRVGKKKAGRELDGRAWDQYPGGDQ